MVMWFGEPWPSAEERAPVCDNDADRVPVPVGQVCGQCGEPLAPRARGVVIPSTTDEPWHLECLLYNTLGPSWETFLP